MVARLLLLGLLACAQAACDADGGGPRFLDGGTGGSAGGGGAGHVPPDLVGTWSIGTLLATEFQDIQTGAFSDPTGNTESWAFAADGTFTHGLYVQVAFGACTSRVYAYEEGVAVVDDDLLSTTPRAGRLIGKDNCNEENNYDRAPNLVPRRQRWRIDAELGGFYLKLTPEGGVTSGFRKME